MNLFYKGSEKGKNSFKSRKNKTQIWLIIKILHPWQFQWTPHTIKYTFYNERCSRYINIQILLYINYFVKLMHYFMANGGDYRQDWPWTKTCSIINLFFLKLYYQGLFKSLKHLIYLSKVLAMILKPKWGRNDDDVDDDDDDRERGTTVCTTHSTV